MTSCPCGSEQPYSECCEPYLTGQAHPATAEALMRSRYTAYTRADVAYIRRTMMAESMHDFDEASAAKWAKDAEWKGLQILSTTGGSATDTRGEVEFIATYVLNGDTLEHHEVSEFRKTGHGEWRFKDGEAHTHEQGEGHHHHHAQTVVRESAKVGRNDPCPCGSGKKYKKCHGTASS